MKELIKYLLLSLLFVSLIALLIVFYGHFDQQELVNDILEIDNDYINNNEEHKTVYQLERQ